MATEMEQAMGMVQRLEAYRYGSEKTKTNPRRHCSNCMNAKVFGGPTEYTPLVRCEALPGPPILPWQLVCRVPTNKGFMDAKKCDEFENASDWQPGVMPKRSDY